MPSPRDLPSAQTAPPPVLILCADKAVADELVRELAGRCYQPLVGRPNWSGQAALEWARPVAVVVDTHHPAARSARFLDTSGDLAVGLILFGDAAAGDVLPTLRRNGTVVSTVPTVDPEVIGGVVDATVRRRSA